jgi:hypothetical protein
VGVMVIEVHLVREIKGKDVVGAYDLLKKHLGYFGVSTEYNNHFFAIIPSAIVEVVYDGFGEEVIIYGEDVSTIKNITAFLNSLNLDFFIDNIKAGGRHLNLEVSRKFEDLNMLKDAFYRVVEELTKRFNPMVMRNTYKVTMITNDAIVSVYHGGKEVSVDVIAQSISAVYSIVKLITPLLGTWELWFEFA